MTPVGAGGPGLRGALARYRALSYAVGVGLILLGLVGVPLQVAANAPQVVHVVGPIHGFLYVAYLVAAADLARRGRWPATQLIPVVLAGLVPFLAFVVERRVTRRTREQLASSR